LAVLASSRWQAERALGQLVAQWVAGEAGTFSDADLERELQSAIEDPSAAHRYRDVGDVDAVFELPERSDATRSLTAEYAVPFLAHAAMEPLACAVKFETDRATVWAGVQIPDVARSAAAKVFELDAEQVALESLYLGGAFGRRLEADFIAQAAAIAKVVPGRLVQVSWRREDDTRNDFFRPAARARLRARLDDAGQVVAFAAHSSGQSIVKQSFERVFGLPAAGPDKTTAEGAFDQPYEFANHRVTHRAVELPVPVGYWRSVGHSQQAFFTETFVDELARMALVDPVEFRARHLREHPRHLAVLKLAAEKARWDTRPGCAADGAPIARGIALNQSFGSIVAEVVEASLSPEGEPRVHRVVVAVDCGVAINPNLIEQQMESAVIYALSAALYGQIHFNEGRVEEGNFDRYRVLRLAETPIIETHIQPSNRPPGGVGEPGVPPLAPALANAVAVLTGKPVRRLPLIGA
jgi:isoquinoline 1-oxidoreductase beta subunit